jgi:hypothetical protein
LFFQELFGECIRQMTDWMLLKKAVEGSLWCAEERCEKVVQWVSLEASARMI